MTSGLTALALLAFSAGGSDGNLSTDRLDEYEQHVQLRRKACGPTAVWYCLHRLGIPVERDDLLREAKLGSEGTSLQTLLELCAARGLHPTAINCANKDIRLLPVPSIVVVDQTHCIVYLGIVEGGDGDEVRYYEPATDCILVMARSRIEYNWTGEAIVFASPRPSPTTFNLIVAGTAVTIVLAGVAIPRLLDRSGLRRGNAT